MPRGNLRRHERIPHGTRVHIVWKNEQGKEEYTSGRTVDVSEAGMRVELSLPVKVGTYVNFRAENFSLHGSASVRSCVRKGIHHVIGLEFSGGLTWQPGDRSRRRET